MSTSLTTTISALPPEIMMQIFGSLSVPDLLHGCGLVSRDWHRLAGASVTSLTVVWPHLRTNPELGTCKGTSSLEDEHVTVTDHVGLVFGPFARKVNLVVKETVEEGDGLADDPTINIITKHPFPLHPRRAHLRVRSNSTDGLDQQHHWLCARFPSVQSLELVTFPLESEHHQQRVLGTLAAWRRSLVSLKLFHRKLNLISECGSGRARLTRAPARQPDARWTVQRLVAGLAPIGLTRLRSLVVDSDADQLHGHDTTTYASVRLPRSLTHLYVRTVSAVLSNGLWRGLFDVAEKKEEVSRMTFPNNKLEHLSLDLVINGLTTTATGKRSNSNSNLHNLRPCSASLRHLTLNFQDIHDDARTNVLHLARSLQLVLGLSEGESFCEQYRHLRSLHLILTSGIKLTTNQKVPRVRTVLAMLAEMLFSPSSSACSLVHLRLEYRSYGVSYRNMWHHCQDDEPESFGFCNATNATKRSPQQAALQLPRSLRTLHLTVPKLPNDDLLLLLMSRPSSPRLLPPSPVARLIPEGTLVVMDLVGAKIHLLMPRLVEDLAPFGLESAHLYTCPSPCVSHADVLRVVIEPPPPPTHHSQPPRICVETYQRMLQCQCHQSSGGVEDGSNRQHWTGRACQDLDRLVPTRHHWFHTSGSLLDDTLKLIRPSHVMDDDESRLSTSWSNINRAVLLG